MDDVAKGHKTLPDYSYPVFPKIPPEFYNDIRNIQANATARELEND